MCETGLIFMCDMTHQMYKSIQGLAASKTITNGQRSLDSKDVVQSIELSQVCLHLCALTYSCVCLVSFIGVTWLCICVTWLHRCDMTLHMCDMACSYIKDVVLSDQLDRGCLHIYCRFSLWSGSYGYWIFWFSFWSFNRILCIICFFFIYSKYLIALNLYA